MASWPFRFRRTLSTPRPTPRAGWSGVRIAVTNLEDRTVPRPTLYLEFGDNFPGSVLTDTVGNFVSLKSGSNPAVNGPALGANSATMTFTSFNSLFGAQSASARSVIVDLVQRYYEPTNIEVVELKSTPTKLSTGETVQAVSSLAEASKLLGANNGQQRNKDTIVWINAIGINGQDQGNFGLLGISNGTDIANFNLSEGSALTIVADPAGGLSSNNDPVDLAITTAHEAGHAFGLRHAYDTTYSNFLGPGPTMYQKSEMMSYLTPFNASGEPEATSAFFSRIPITAGDNNTNINTLEGAKGTNGPFNQFAADPDVGQNPLFDYVTGSGAHDLVTIAKTDATTVTVTVSPFLAKDYTNAITIPASGGKTTYTYTIPFNAAKTLIVDGGLGDDRITVDANLGMNVKVRGQGGTDSLVLNGTGSETVTYTPGTNTAPYYDNSSDLRGTLAVGGMTIDFSEFEAKSGLTVQNVSAVGISTPGGSDDVALGLTAAGLPVITGTFAGVPSNYVPLSYGAGVTTVIVDVGQGDAPADVNKVTLNFKNGNPLTKVNAVFKGGVGTDSTPITFNGDFVYTAKGFTIDGSANGLQLVGIDDLSLTGGTKANLFDFADYAGAATLDGLGGTDTVRVARDADFTLTATALKASAGGSLTLANIETAELTGGKSANTFNLAAWAGTAKLDGLDGADTYILSPGLQPLIAADSGADGATDKLTVAGSDGDDTFNFTTAGVEVNGVLVQYSGIESVVSDGGLGNDTFLVDVTPGLTKTVVPALTGGPGANTLAFVGLPPETVAQGSVRFTSASTGVLILDPDGSSGPVQSGTAGTDALVVNFDGFGIITNTVPVSRFDFGLSVSADAVTVDNGPAVNGLITLSVTSNGVGVRLANAAVVNVATGGGADTVVIDAPAVVPGLGQLRIYGNAAPDVAATDDAASDSFEIRNTGVPVLLDGQGGSDSFTVGAAPGGGTGTDGILAAVTVAGGSGNNSLTLSDWGSAAGNADVRITASGVSGLLGVDGKSALTVSGIGTWSVFGSNADKSEAFGVDAFPFPLALNTYAGDDAITVRNQTAPLALDPGAGNDTVSVSTTVLTANFIVDLGTGDDTATFTNVTSPGSLTIRGGAGNDKLTAAANTPALMFDLGTGNNSAVASDAPGSVAADGGDGDDAVTVARAKGAVVLNLGVGNDSATVVDSTGAVTVNAGPGANTVVVSGSSGAVTVTAGDGDDGIQIAGSTAPSVTVDGAGGNNTFTLTNVTSAAPVTVVGGAGGNTVTLTRVTAPSVTVDTGTGADAVAVIAPGGPTTVSTGAGNDAIAVDSAPAPVSVLAGDGDDRMTVGGSNLDGLTATVSIDGGTGADFLTLSDTANPNPTAYGLSATGVTRPGLANLVFGSVEAFGLNGGSAANTYTVASVPAGGLNILDGDGGSTFVLPGSVLTAPVSLNAAGGDDTFLIDASSGVAGDLLTLRSGPGNDTARLTGKPQEPRAYLNLETGAAGVGGYGAFVRAFDTETIDLAGGGGAGLNFADFTGTSLGGTGLRLSPTGADSGRFAAPSWLGTALTYSGFSETALFGDPEETGTADGVTVDAFSGAFGRDSITVSPTRVTIRNAAGFTLDIPVSGASALFLNTGDEVGLGDDVTVSPSVNTPLTIDGQGGSDRITVPVIGLQTIEPAGDGLTKLSQSLDDGYVLYTNFETAPRYDVVAVATGAGTPSRVKVYDAVTNALKFELAPYKDDFLGGVSVATGDVNGDGVADIIVGAGPGGGPHVQVFDGATGTVILSFFAYEDTFTGGVQVAAGDVDGDGHADLVLGTGIGGGPRAQVISGLNGAVLANFFAYEDSFRNGVQVAAGDIDGDGLSDVVTGSGVGGGPRVRAFRGTDGAGLADFFAYDDTFRSGVNVAAGDLNGDGFADIITGPGSAGVPVVKAFNGDGTRVLTEIDLGDEPKLDGPAVRVAAADLDRNGVKDIVTGRGPGAKPVVRGFRVAPGAAEPIYDFSAFDDAAEFGIYVG